MCKSLGVFATAHADGKLHLRTLPNLEGGGGPTATIGEQPVQTLTDSPAAIIQVRTHFWVMSASLLHACCCFNRIGSMSLACWKSAKLQLLSGKGVDHTSPKVLPCMLVSSFCCCTCPGTLCQLAMMWNVTLLYPYLSVNYLLKTHLDHTHGQRLLWSRSWHQYSMQCMLMLVKHVQAASCKPHCHIAFATLLSCHTALRCCCGPENVCAINEVVNRAGKSHTIRKSPWLLDAEDPPYLSA